MTQGLDITKLKENLFFKVGGNICVCVCVYIYVYIYIYMKNWHNIIVNIQIIMTVTIVEMQRKNWI